MEIDTAIPAGNAMIERIEGDHVYLHQDPRDTLRHWFYWHFRVRGAAGKTLTFHLTSENTITIRGPAVSLDQGWRWEWIGENGSEPWTFRYSFPDSANDVRFSMGMPYTERNVERFLGSIGTCSRLVKGTLCLSRKGRRVEKLTIRCSGPAPRCRVLLTARHHCCEMMANSVLEGILLAALAEGDLGAWFSRNVEVLAVPFVDKDGVEEGDQGKCRTPHDHWCDYGDSPLYPETASIIQQVSTWRPDTPLIAFDLHCPWIRGSANNHQICLVGSENRDCREAQSRFAECLERHNSGPLPYKASNTLPFGTAWNTPEHYTGTVTCEKWAETLSNTRLAGCFEFPYADVEGVAVTPDSYRRFGSSIAAAIRALVEL